MGEIDVPLFNGRMNKFEFFSCASLAICDVKAEGSVVKIPKALQACGCSSARDGVIG